MDPGSGLDELAPYDCRQLQQRVARLGFRFAIDCFLKRLQPRAGTQCSLSFVHLLTVYRSGAILSIVYRKSYHALRTCRSASRNPRSADIEGRLTGTTARPRHLAPDRTDYQWDIPSEARVALPRPTSHGGPKLAVGGVGRIGSQPAGQILPPHEGRQAATGNGNEALGSRGDRNWQC